MPTFRFKARSPSGELLGGVIEARDLDDARMRITGRGQQVVELAPAVLPRPPRPVPPPPPRRRCNLAALLLVLLLAAVAALLYLDPFAWDLWPWSS